MKPAVLVTGGARRIGAAICRALAVAGWRVLVHARRKDDPDAVALAAEIGGVALFEDLSDPLGPGRLFNRAVEAAPEISAVVNNAAVFTTAASLAPDAEKKLFAVNAEAPEKLGMMLALRLDTNGDTHCHACADMSGTLPKRGAVVNLLDNRVLRPAEGEEGPYARSKRALLAAQEELAESYAPTIRVNGVAPGPVLVPPGGGEKGGEILLDARPTPEDVAAAVVFLLSASGVTGAVLPVDAGQHLLV